MNPTLQNRTILITRPAQQATALGELIKQQGGQFILLPTIAIEPVTERQRPELTGIMQNLAQQDIAVFVSVNAVQAVHLLMQKYQLAWPEQLAIAAVGSSTAQALAELNLTVSLVPDYFNSEALLALPALQTVRNKRIIIFRGEGGREVLSKVLCERGALLTEAVVYKRILPVMDIQPFLTDWQQGNLAIIVATSNTGLQNLLIMVGQAAHRWLFNMPLLVISERMAHFAQELGFVKKPVVADNATDTAIVHALLNYYAGNQ